MTNTWPGGYRHSLYPDEHEVWNETNYPGTRQMCTLCDEPTGRCEEDTLWTKNGEPLCEACADKNPEIIDS